MAIMHCTYMGNGLNIIGNMIQSFFRYFGMPIMHGLTLVSQQLSKELVNLQLMISCNLYDIMTRTQNFCCQTKVLK